MAFLGIGRAVSVVVRIEANLQWQVFRDPGTEEWLGVCQPLNLNAIGDTFGDFIECANEATQLLLTELLEKGELPAFLRRHGWTPSTLPVPGTRVRWDVPFEVRQRSRFEELEPQPACRQQGTGRLVSVPLRDLLPERLAEIILAQAGLTQAAIRELPCAICRLRGERQESRTEVEHWVTKARGGYDLGDTFPTCAKHRRMRHTMGDETFQREMGFDGRRLCLETMSDLYYEKLLGQCYAADAGLAALVAERDALAAENARLRASCMTPHDWHRLDKPIGTTYQKCSRCGKVELPRSRPMAGPFAED